MFRASLSKTFLGPHRPSWVDQLLSPESLRAAGYFDPEAVARERSRQMAIPRITARRFVFDVALTSVVSTQLWHHLYCGGGLCDLPTWTDPTLAGNRTPGRYRVKHETDLVGVGA
jgi:asparagine synthase (glutamine-hydrolysing)